MLLLLYKNVAADALMLSFCWKDLLLFIFYSLIRCILNDPLRLIGITKNINSFSEICFFDIKNLPRKLGKLGVYIS